MSQLLTPELANEYTLLFNTCIIDPEHNAEIERAINIMIANKSTYDTIVIKEKTITQGRSRYPRTI